jgi:hypothetical protein
MRELYAVCSPASWHAPCLLPRDRRPARWWPNRRRSPRPARMAARRLEPRCQGRRPRAPNSVRAAPHVRRMVDRGGGIAARRSLQGLGSYRLEPEPPSLFQRSSASRASSRSSSPLWYSAKAGFRLRSSAFGRGPGADSGVVLSGGARQKSSFCRRFGTIGRPRFELGTSSLPDEARTGEGSRSSHT